MFKYETRDGMVKLNLQQDDLECHLQGFCAYVARLPSSGESRSKAQELIKRTKSVLGVFLPCPVDPDSDAFRSLVHIIATFNGFMFVVDSVMLPDGSILVGPTLKEENTDEKPTAELKEINPDNFRHSGETTGVDPSRIEMRERHYCLLAERAFICARWLPLYRTESGVDELRPVEEIAARFLALCSLFLWVSAPEDVAPTNLLKEFYNHNNLDRHLTMSENAIVLMAREDARESHHNTIGWYLENMWALAWILGFEPEPPFYQGQLPDEVIQRMIGEFFPGFTTNITEFIAAIHPRSAIEVGQLEDLYYCTHNAVRQAQLGDNSVPTYFHPVADGGAIHERRHSLTWALSPGTEWEDTDLST
ncbi:DUF4272 domain-containing protein [bacterium]|nr:DUF4272 domain-containing protein [bacterium]